MWFHFLHGHIRYTVIILEEGKKTHPRCPQCDMLVPWRVLNGQHLTTSQWDKGAERKIWRVAEDNVQEST